MHTSIIFCVVNVHTQYYATSYSFVFSVESVFLKYYTAQAVKSASSIVDPRS